MKKELVKKKKNFDSYKYADFMMEIWNMYVAIKDAKDWGKRIYYDEMLKHLGINSTPEEKKVIDAHSKAEDILNTQILPVIKKEFREDFGLEIASLDHQGYKILNTETDYNTKIKNTQKSVIRLVKGRNVSIEVGGKLYPVIAKDNRMILPEFVEKLLKLSPKLLEAHVSIVLALPSPEEKVKKVVKKK